MDCCHCKSYNGITYNELDKYRKFCSCFILSWSMVFRVLQKPGSLEEEIKMLKAVNVKAHGEKKFAEVRIKCPECGRSHLEDISLVDTPHEIVYDCPGCGRKITTDIVKEM